MKVGLAGDWHGNGPAARNSIYLLRKIDPEIDTVYHLGDFGIWPGRYGTEFLDAVQDTYQRAEAMMYVTLGNHEDYPQIASFESDENGVKWPRPNIGLLPRGFRWELGGCSFVSLGGAPSVDYTFRQRGVDWWPEEMITREEAQAVADGGYADIMLAHDSPDDGCRAVMRIIEDPQGVVNWGVEGIRWARVGRIQMNAAYAGVLPKLFAHGHYHVADFTVKDDGRTFLSLDMQNTRANLAVLDLDTLEITIVDPYQDDHHRGLYVGQLT